MTSLRLEIEGDDEGAPVLPLPAAELLGFCSFAFALRFGAQHELSLVAQRLKERYGVDLRVFTTYAEGVVREQADSDDLERAWQDPGRLAENAGKALQAIRSGDEKLAGWLAEWPEFSESLEELALRAHWAAERARRVRLVFFLDEGERPG